MDDTKLPEGKTCSDCVHFKPKCEWFLSISGTETSCDWSPSKFREKPRNPPLTDEEVARKFVISKDDPGFDAARRLSRSWRPDRTVSEIPDIMCPWCGESFTATFYDLGSNDPANGDELACPECERIIFIEGIDEPEGGEDSGEPAFVRLCTHRPEEKQ